eukprot:9077798-Pyramimonas_sp.AAC.1
MLLRYQSVVGSPAAGPCRTTSVRGGAADGASLSSLASPGVLRLGQGAARQHQAACPGCPAA